MDNQSNQGVASLKKNQGMRQPLPPIKEGSPQQNSSNNVGWDNTAVVAKQMEQDQAIQKLKLQYESQQLGQGNITGSSNQKGLPQQQPQQHPPPQQQQQFPMQRITDLKSFEKSLNNDKDEFMQQSRVKIKVTQQNFASRQRSAEALRHTYNETTRAGTTLGQTVTSNQRYNHTVNNNLYATTGGKVPNVEALDSLQDLTMMLTQGQKKFKSFKKGSGSSGSGNERSSTFFEMLPVHIKEFYQGKRDFLKPLADYDITNYCLMEANERVRCYRYEMGSLMERIGCNYHKIIERLLDATIKLFNENKQKFDLQIAENLNIIERLEKEKKEMEANNRDLKNRYIVQESLYKITKINSDALQNEVILLHELLRKDVLNMINHLGTLETSQASKLQMQMQAQKDDPSDHLVQGLANLSGLITSLESEQGQKEGMMTTMNGLLKAMLKGTKREAYTQVDEGELQWAPNRIINEDNPMMMPAYLDMEHMSINFQQQQGEQGKSTTALSNLEVLKMKEKELGIVQPSLVRKAQGAPTFNSSENWNLPATMIVLLENVAKSNETGRVIPWVHFRKMIFDIYLDRLQSQWEVAGSLLTSTIGLDEFTCLYFLKTYKLRRVAELQLFEFLVSLRYFIKQQSRAAMFSFLSNITSFPSAAQTATTAGGVAGGGGQQQQQAGGGALDTAMSYKFDIYLQNFFLFALQALIDDKSCIFETEQATFVSRERAEKQTDYILAFTSEQGRQRVQQKLKSLSEKIKEFENGECVDVDKLIDLYIEEYFECKKKLTRNFAKNFSKAFEDDHGIFAIDSLRLIVKDTLEAKSPYEQFSFPRDVNLSRAFFYALTSTKNKFDIASKDFLYSCSRYGIDCPFPFVYVGSGGTKKLIADGTLQQQQQQQPSSRSNIDKKDLENAKSPNQSIGGNNQSMTQAPPIQQQGSLSAFSRVVNPKEDQKKAEGDKQGGGVGNQQQIPQGNQDPQSLKSSLKIEASSTLFAQHFSILRELRTYCKNFKDSYQKEEDAMVLWTQFGVILNILEAGCQFLNFPINI